MSNSRKKRRDNYRASQIDWRDVWPMPLVMEEYDGGYAYSQDRTMALTFEADTEYQIKNSRRILRIINGEAEPNPGEAWVNNGVDFYTPDKNYEETVSGWCYVFCVRGWGHLAGTGGLNLPAKGAARIQDDFIEYILNRLNGKK